MKKSIIVALLIAVLILPFACIAEDADGEPEGTTIYCYGDHPNLTYPYDITGVTVGWSAKNESGAAVPCVPAEGKDSSVSLEGTDRVYVTQTVTSGTAVKTETFTLIALHIGDGTYTLRFLDGSAVLDVQTISRRTVVTEGSPFAIVPADPSKTGFTFGGWFTDIRCTQPFDPFTPILGSTDVYAKWIGHSSGGTGTVVVIGGTGTNHVVAFEVCPGMTYRILSNSGGKLSFSVGPVEGYDMDLSTLKVSADGKTLESTDGIYSIDRIDSDITVAVHCDMRETPSTPPVPPEPSQPPEGGEKGSSSMPIILLVIVIVLLVTAIAYRYHCTRRS